MHKIYSRLSSLPSNMRKSITNGSSKGVVAYKAALRFASVNQLPPGQKASSSNTKNLPLLAL
jgi:hypothetical protein